MAHVSYPDSFPLECVSDLIQIGRGGFDEFIVRKAEVGLHSWNIGGFALKVALGDPDAPPIFGSPDEEADVADRLDEFVGVFSSCCADRISAEAMAEVKVVREGFGAGRVDWAKWAKFFLEVVLPIILTI